LETLPTATSNAFGRDLGLAQKAARSGIVPDRARAADTHWDLWHSFCHSLDLDPTVENFEDPVTLLQVFAQRYRTGAIAPRGKPVRSRTVEDALRSVGQTLAMLGAQDPRLNHVGRVDFRLQRQLKCYSKEDPPPDRVKPIPVHLLRYVMAVAFANTAVANQANQATADMIVLAFFFLLRPGEYTAMKSDTTPFRMQDVQLFVGGHRLDPLAAPLATIRTATFATLTFTSQKNGVRGEVIGLSRSGNPLLCPVLAIVRRLTHLRENNAPPSTPLAVYVRPGDGLTKIAPADITTMLRTAATALGPSIGFLAKDISARSLRAGGAMALLCAHVDTDTIRLIGRWRSDEMLRYLHVQAEPIMRDFAKKMLLDGAFTLLPSQDVPMF